MFPLIEDFYKIIFLKVRYLSFFFYYKLMSTKIQMVRKNIDMLDNQLITKFK
jgi:hypothetical protein